MIEVISSFFASPDFLFLIIVVQALFMIYVSEKAFKNGKEFGKLEVEEEALSKLSLDLKHSYFHAGASAVFLWIFAFQEKREEEKMEELFNRILIDSHKLSEDELRDLALTSIDGMTRYVDKKKGEAQNERISS